MLLVGDGIAKFTHGNARLDIVAADEERDLAAATAVEVRPIIFGNIEM